MRNIFNRDCFFNYRLQFAMLPSCTRGFKQENGGINGILNNRMLDHGQLPFGVSLIGLGKVSNLSLVLQIPQCSKYPRFEGVNRTQVKQLQILSLGVWSCRVYSTKESSHGVEPHTSNHFESQMCTFFSEPFNQASTSHGSELRIPGKHPETIFSRG